MLVCDTILLLRKVLGWGLHFLEDGSCSGGVHNLGKLWVFRQENGNQEVGEGTLAILWMGSLGSGIWLFRHH